MIKIPVYQPTVSPTPVIPIITGPKSTPQVETELTTVFKPLTISSNLPATLAPPVGNQGQITIQAVSPQTPPAIHQPISSTNVSQGQFSLAPLAQRAPGLAPLSGTKLAVTKEPVKAEEQFSLDEPISWHKFRRDDLYLLPSDQEKSYFSRKITDKKILAWGQRKLALMTLSFINLYWQPDQLANPIIVYAGASPAKNLNFIISLYPRIIWHLYDPKGKFDVELGPNVFTYNERFTNSTAEKWAGHDVFFISDIRSVDRFVLQRQHKDQGAEMVERGIWQDMLDQQEWVQIMKPLAAQLKFRLPYSNIKFADDIDYKSGYVPYLAGIVFKQPWVRPSSTETRLVITRNMMRNNRYPQHNWSIKSYEDRLFFHNAVVREKYRYYNPFYPDDPKLRQTSILSPELNSQWDSLVEITILNDYLIKTGQSGDILSLLQGLNKLLTVKLTKNIDQIITLAFLRENPFYLRRIEFDPNDE